MQYNTDTTKNLIVKIVSWYLIEIEKESLIIALCVFKENLHSISNSGDFKIFNREI